MLTIKEAAELIGVSDQSIRRWIKAGDLPAYKPGKEYRVSREDLWKFLDSRRSESPKDQALLLLNPTEEQKAAHNVGSQWIEYLKQATAHWKKELEAPSISLEEVLELSQLSFSLCSLYMLEEDVIRAWCDGQKEKALDEAEEEIEQVFARIDELVEIKVRERNLALNDVADLTKFREQRAKLQDARRLKANA